VRGTLAVKSEKEGISLEKGGREISASSGGASAEAGTKKNKHRAEQSRGC